MWLMLSMMLMMSLMNEKNNMLESKNNMMNMLGMMGVDNMTMMLCWMMEILNLMLQMNMSNVMLSMMMNISMLLTVSVLEYTLFYMYYESMLMPMSMMVLKGNGSLMSSKGMVRLIYNTCLSSMGMLLSMLMYMYSQGNTMMDWLWMTMMDNMLSLMSFSMKMPMNPLHKWLMYVLSESSTMGSMMLGGLMLKLGMYGIISMNMKSKENFLILMMMMMTMMSCLYSSLTMFLEMDMKSMMAYSSIMHMNIMYGNMILMDWMGIYNSILLTFTLSLICSGLFMMMGMFSNSYLTKDYLYLSGVNLHMNLFSKFMLFLFFSNISMPLTSSFIGEILILLNFMLLFGFISFFYFYCILLINILFMWYNTSILYTYINIYILLVFDITSLEFFILILFSFYIFFFGIFPYFFTFLSDSFSFFYTFF